MNLAFDGAENAIHDIVADYGMQGIISGLQPVQDGAGSLNVLVTAGLAYDPQGDRIFVPVQQTLNCSVDMNSVSTAVSTSGHSKIVSVFVQFERVLSDPRTDGNAVTVYFQQDEGFQLNVIQGAEAVSPTPPALQGNMLLLADLTFTFGMSQVLTAGISYARSQIYGTKATVLTATASPGTRFSTVAGSVQSQLNALQGGIDAIESNGVDTIKQFASVAALRATAAPPAYATNAVCTVPGFGLFVWSPSSTALDDLGATSVVVQPTGVVTGRWLALSTGRLPAGLPHFGLVNAQTVIFETGSILAAWGAWALNYQAQTGDIFILLLNVSANSGNFLSFGATGAAAGTIHGAVNNSVDAASSGIMVAVGNGTIVFGGHASGAGSITSAIGTILQIRP